VEHTKVERDILKEVDHPFLVKLHYAFQVGSAFGDICPWFERYFDWLS
jgi:hypothetical protein